MNPRPVMIDFPSSFDTDRLTIRGPLPGDGRELNAAIAETIDDLRPWMPWAQAVPAEEESEENIRQAYVDFLARRDLRLNLYLKGTGVFVGGSGLHRIDWNIPKFEIGYWCRRRFVGQGYISEAVQGITRFAFETLGARRVEIRCDARNDRSRKVAERAGYTLEGILRNDALATGGDLRDTLIFAMIPAEYAASSRSKTIERTAREELGR